MIKIRLERTVKRLDISRDRASEIDLSCAASIEKHELSRIFAVNGGARDLTAVSAFDLRPKAVKFRHI